MFLYVAVINSILTGLMFTPTSPPTKTSGKTIIGVAFVQNESWTVHKTIVQVIYNYI